MNVEVARVKYQIEQALMEQDTVSFAGCQLHIKCSFPQPMNID